jgi:hypothetical protein
MKMDLIPLEIYAFDVILGMNCFRKTINFKVLIRKEVEFRVKDE